jgi:hypothetical protein
MPFFQKTSLDSCDEGQTSLLVHEHKKDRLKTRAGRLHCLYYCVVLGVLAESELLLFTSRKAPLLWVLLKSF